MPEMTFPPPGVLNPHSGECALNMKLLFDEQLDNRREVAGNARAWESIKLRKAHNAESFDHFVNMLAASASLIADQTGQTANQQTVSPIRTATGDAIAAVPGVAAGAEATANAAIAASIGNLASALVPIIVAAGGVVSAQTLATMLPVIVSAVGTASKDAQPKTA